MLKFSDKWIFESKVIQGSRSNKYIYQREGLDQSGVVFKYDVNPFTNKKTIGNVKVFGRKDGRTY